MMIVEIGWRNACGHVDLYPAVRREGARVPAATMTTLEQRQPVGAVA